MYDPDTRNPDGTMKYRGGKDKAKKAAARNRYSEKMRAESRCVNCGGDTLGYVECPSCLAFSRARHERTMERKRSAATANGLKRKRCKTCRRVFNWTPAKQSAGVKICCKCAAQKRRDRERLKKEGLFPPYRCRGCDRVLPVVLRQVGTCLMCVSPEDDKWVRVGRQVLRSARRLLRGKSPRPLRWPAKASTRGVTSRR